MFISNVERPFFPSQASCRSSKQLAALNHVITRRQVVHPPSKIVFGLCMNVSQKKDVLNGASSQEGHSSGKVSLWLHGHFCTSGANGTRPTRFPLGSAIMEHVNSLGPMGRRLPRRDHAGKIGGSSLQMAGFYVKDQGISRLKRLIHGVSPFANTSAHPPG